MIKLLAHSARRIGGDRSVEARHEDNQMGEGFYWLESLNAFGDMPTNSRNRRAR
jgi:hypothetical protein